ncbi:MAG TPA: hypothetical protein VFD15_01145 [Clostridia bacterium]|nr:hypothetical protein [Clostridia bacterium]
MAKKKKKRRKELGEFDEGHSFLREKTGSSMRINLDGQQKQENNEKD